MGLNGTKSGYFRHRDYIDFTLLTLVKMTSLNKASNLKSFADVAPNPFQLVVMLFVAVAVAVPTEMLKREVESCISQIISVYRHISSPTVLLNRRPCIALPSVALLIV